MSVAGSPNRPKRPESAKRARKAFQAALVVSLVAALLGVPATAFGLRRRAAPVTAAPLPMPADAATEPVLPTAAD